jgi:hypothetical protein
MMFNDYVIKELGEEKQKACLHRAAKARLLKNVRPDKQGFKCLVCEKLAGYFLKAGKQLEELARKRPVNEMPAMKNEDLRRLLEDSARHGVHN